MPPKGAHKQAVNRQRKKHVAHGGGHDGADERWLVTYADMLTLLLVLFIVLYSISVVNTSKFISLKTSLAAVFGQSGNGHSILSGGTGLQDNDNTGTGQQEVMAGLPVAAKPGAKGSDNFPQATVKNGYTQQDVQKEVADFHRIEEAVSAALVRKGLRRNVQFLVTKRGLVIRLITNKLVFPPNSAELLTMGQSIVAAVAAPLATKEKRSIEVDGFTNQLKVSTGPYPSGWELSSARASTVVRYFQSHGVAASRLTAVGYSDQRPLYPPSDPRAETLNRRVEVVVLSSLPAAAGDDLASAGNPKSTK
jgi:chemotaxis protein MotB